MSQDKELTTLNLFDNFNHLNNFYQEFPEHLKYYVSSNKNYSSSNVSHTNDSLSPKMYKEYSHATTQNDNPSKITNHYIYPRLTHQYLKHHLIFPHIYVCRTNTALNITRPTRRRILLISLWTIIVIDHLKINNNFYILSLLPFYQSYIFS